jgi:hypothetical protein
MLGKVVNDNSAAGRSMTINARVKIVQRMRLRSYSRWMVESNNRNCQSDQKLQGAAIGAGIHMLHCR